MSEYEEQELARLIDADAISPNHVSLFAGLTDDFRAVFDFKSGVRQHQKFNTREEANKFVESVRRRLKRQGRTLRQHHRDYAR